MSEVPAFSHAYPERQISEVDLALTDGTVRTGRCEEMRGGPSRPLGLDELERKFRDLAIPVWGTAAAERLREGCLGLEAIPDFAAFATGVPLEAT